MISVTLKCWYVLAKSSGAESGQRTLSLSLSHYHSLAADRDAFQLLFVDFFISL